MLIEAINCNTNWYKFLSNTHYYYETIDETPFKLLFDMEQCLRRIYCRLFKRIKEY